MNDTPNNNDLRPLLYVIAAIIIALIVLQIVSMIVALLLVFLIAAALYYGATTGYKLAMDSEVWEERKIGKDRKLEASRKAELAYFESQGKAWMTQVVNNHYDDQERELYQNNGGHVETITKNIRKVKEIFK